MFSDPFQFTSSLLKPLTVNLPCKDWDGCSALPPWSFLLPCRTPSADTLAPERPLGPEGPPPETQQNQGTTSCHSVTKPPRLTLSSSAAENTALGCNHFHAFQLHNSLSKTDYRNVCESCTQSRLW